MQTWAQTAGACVPRGLVPEERDTEAAAECEAKHAQARPRRISWARQLKRVFGIDTQHCPNCGSPRECRDFLQAVRRWAAYMPRSD
jgi:hypothetical protein